MRAFSSQSEYDVFFSKVFSVFEFWTFLKMSIFHSALDFLKNSSQQYILLKLLKAEVTFRKLVKLLLIYIIVPLLNIHKIIISTNINYDSI